MVDFYGNLLDLYYSIKFPKEYDDLSKINKHISWYFADQEKSLVTSTNRNNQLILEVDITSAFTTICLNLYDHNSEFIKNIKILTDKRERNKYIAINLKGEKLKLLNIICKIIILGIIFDTNDEYEIEDIQILELKKDGIVLTCSIQTYNRLININNIDRYFSHYITKNNFKFHIMKFNSYIRSNKTSYFSNKDNLIIKGSYKYVPIHLKNIILELMNVGLSDNINNLKKYYNNNYMMLIRQFHFDKFQELYMCNEDQILNSEYKYEKYSMKSKINPQLYLKMFVYPAMILNIGQRLY